MDTFDDRLSWLESRVGPGFAAAVAPDGALRLWIVHHLADETGESPQTVEAAIDDWLRDHPSGDLVGAEREPLRLDDRIEMLFEQRRKLDPIGDAYDIALLDAEIGAALNDIGRPFDALSRFMGAREVFTREDAHLDVGVCAMEMGLVCTDLGWHAEAKHFFEGARPVIAGYGTVGDFARLLIGQANLERAVDSIVTARDLLHKAQWLASEARETRTLAVATHNLANIASAQGDIDGALELFEQARALHDDLGNSVAAATCDKNAGSALIDNGRYEAGLALARGALDAYVTNGWPVEAAHARRTIAHALDHLGDHEGALAELQQARIAYSSTSQLPLVAAVDIDLSYTLRSLRRFEEAAAVVHNARDVHREIGYDADDAWFEQTLGAIERREIDDHDHPVTEDLR